VNELRQHMVVPLMDKDVKIFGIGPVLNWHAEPYEGFGTDGQDTTRRIQKAGELRSGKKRLSVWPVDPGPTYCNRLEGGTWAVRL
jgi:hypothetical protein